MFELALELVDELELELVLCENGALNVTLEVEEEDEEDNVRNVDELGTALALALALALPSALGRTLACGAAIDWLPATRPCGEADEDDDEAGEARINRSSIGMMRSKSTR